MALIACHECGHQIAATAKTCPNCNARNRNRWSAGQITMLAGAAIIIVLWLGSQFGAPVNAVVQNGLLAKRAECREHLANLLRAGLRVDRDLAGETSAEIEETAWSAIDHDSKVGTALTIYCADMPDDGRYAVFIRGRRNGRILATVSNGNYFDD